MKRNRLKRSGLLDAMVDRQTTDLALHADSNVLVYLIHGVTGAPTEMHYVARGLARHGWDIYATTLPGHCTRIRDLLRTNDRDWREHVQTQLAFGREHYQVVFVVGLCSGGLLALIGAAAVNVDGLGMLSPTIAYDGWNAPWTRTLLPFAMKHVPLFLQPLFFHRDGPPFGIKDETLQAQIRAAYRLRAILREWACTWWARRTKPMLRREQRLSSAASKGYPLFPLKTLTDIDRLITRVRGCMDAILAPTVILQAREDDMTNPRNAYLIYNGIGSPVKRLVFLDDCYHVITVDKQRHAVVQHLIDFFGLYTAGGALANKTVLAENSE